MCWLSHLFAGVLAATNWTTNILNCRKFFKFHLSLICTSFDILLYSIIPLDTIMLKFSVPTTNLCNTICSLPLFLQSMVHVISLIDEMYVFLVQYVYRHFFNTVNYLNTDKVCFSINILFDVSVRYLHITEFLERMDICELWPM